MIVAVQYHVLPDKVYDAFYRLANANMQITAFVFDVVRARVPRIKLDDLFEKKDEIADAVKNELSHVMYDFGYGIVKALVTDIDPDHKVKEAMNAINAAQRMRVAATEKGEADRILKVKAAEAEAQSKALQGKGIADQRRAIVDGLRESVDEFQKSVPGTSPQDVMNLVLMTQYFDTLKEIGASSRDQHDPDPALARQPDRPDRADAQRHDHRRPGRPDGPSTPHDRDHATRGAKTRGTDRCRLTLRWRDATRLPVEAEGLSPDGAGGAVAGRGARLAAPGRQRLGRAGRAVRIEGDARRRPSRARRRPPAGPAGSGGGWRRGR